jgi:succinylglutamate desuccinylase
MQVSTVRLCVVSLVSPELLKEYQEKLTQWLSVTSQKTWILHKAIVETSNHFKSVNWSKNMYC